MYSRVLTRAAALAVATLLLSTSVVWADNAVADGDGVTPVGDNSMAFGTIVCGVESPKTALIAISRNGSATGTNTFGNNASVTVSVQSVIGAGLSAQMGSPSTITLPANWTELANNSLSSSVASTVRITSSTAGADSGSVTYSAAGLNSAGDSITRTDVMYVSWTTGSCAPSDTTPPTVTVPANMIVEATGPSGATATFSASATDLVDGSLTPTCAPASGSTFGLGTTTVTCSATDTAGNMGSATFSVRVYLTLYGFYQPVDMNSVFNVVKGGSTVPLKFEVFAGTTELTSTSVVKSFVQTKVACVSGAIADEIEVTSTGGTSLRYDSTGGQFIQNWQTPKLPGQCYRVTMTTLDDSTLVAFFKLK